MRTLLLLLAALSLGSSAYADELADANQLFDFAEKTYTRYFSPAGQTTQTLQGYLVRYYPDTNSYLGTSGGSVYVHGQQFGVGIIRVGNVTDFITPATGAANTVVDLTNRILTRRAANCSDFAGSYQGTAQDFARNLSFTGNLAIAVSNGSCTFTSNNIPNHTMGEGGAVNIVHDAKLKVIAESFRDWGRDCWCPSGVDNTCNKRFEWQLGELPAGHWRTLDEAGRRAVFGGT